MTEDEAFVRAVVDSPGDDTPRLVYADWLDERADPRGAYLRAELEWANKLRRGPPSKAFAEKQRLERRVRRLGKALDAVWVARVSRPPVGVCCDHMRFFNPGPALTTADLNAVERRLRGRLPTDFRAFLLNHNGGTPSPSSCPYPESYGWDDMDLQVGTFYVARRRVDVVPKKALDPSDREIEAKRDFMESLFRDGGGEGNNPLIKDMAPFVDTLYDLGYFLIGIGGHKLGRVFHFGDYCHGIDNPRQLRDYAPTFAEFLTRIL